MNLGQDGKIKPSFSLEFGDQHSLSMRLNTLQTTIFPVVLIKDNVIRSIGTCFAISPHGLCMTAKHVLEDVPLITNPDEPGSLMVDGHLGVMYLKPPEEDASPDSDLFGGFIPIRTAHTIDGIDIGVMHLNLPMFEPDSEPLSLPAFRLKLDLPPQGERLLAFGYEKGEWTNDGGITHTLAHNFSATTGILKTIHPAGRDRALMPTPCFETSACFKPGMSGGPVMDEQGFVIGVISTGFSVVEDEEPLSYASPVSAAMGISLRGIDSTGAERLMFLWDFASGENSALKVEVGNATVERTPTELFVRSGRTSYQSHLGS